MEIDAKHRIKKHRKKNTTKHPKNTYGRMQRKNKNIQVKIKPLKTNQLEKNYSNSIFPSIPFGLNKRIAKRRSA